MSNDDADLVQAVRMGDHDAFNVLIERHRRHVVALVGHILGDATSED